MERFDSQTHFLTIMASCVYTHAFTESKEEDERDERFSCFAGFSDDDEINTLT